MFISKFMPQKMMGTKSSFSLPETAELVNLTGDAERVERGDARGGGLSVLHCS